MQSIRYKTLVIAHFGKEKAMFKYEYLVIGMFLLILVLFFTAIGLKVHSDRSTIKNNKKKKEIATEIYDIVASIDTGMYVYASVVDFSNKYKKKSKKKRCNKILQEVLFEMFKDTNDDSRMISHAIAQEMEIGKKCIKYLKSRRVSKIIQGCVLAKTYKYNQSIPYLLKNLKKASKTAQYDILTALARLDNPEAMMQALEIVSDSLVTSDRIVAEIIKWMSLQNRVILFEYIISINNKHIQALFLSYIDKHTALELKDAIITKFLEHQDTNLRCAAIKTVAYSKDSRHLLYLVSELSNKHTCIRIQAIKALRGIPNYFAVPYLVKVSMDPDWIVRFYATKALLSYPNYKEAISRILKTKNALAIESLYYAAELKGVVALVSQVNEENKEKEETLVAGNKASYSNSIFVTNA